MIFNRLISIFYPKRCPYCQEIIAHNKMCCEDCEKKAERCLDRTLVFENENGVKSHCFTPLLYNGTVKQAIWRFKFRGCRSYSEYFASEIVNGLNDVYYNYKFDVVTFVPMSKSRKLERGYNQAEVLAKEVGKDLGVKCDKLLDKVKDNDSQHDLNAAQRAKNILGVYKVRDRSLVEDKMILICDDVFTTGSTLRECCKILYEAGAKSVECAAIAHVKLE